MGGTIGTLVFLPALIQVVEDIKTFFKGTGKNQSRLNMTE